MPIEKRKERRIKVSLPMKIVFRDNEIICNTGNLSRLGAYAEIDREIPPGAGLEIALTIPPYSGDPSLSGEARCKGNVFRCGPVREENSKKYYGAGIFFTGFSAPEDRDKLSRYIDYLILREEKGLKEGVMQWRKKRRKAGSKKRADTEILNLLKRVMERLDDISKSLKSRS